VKPSILKLNIRPVRWTIIYLHNRDDLFSGLVRHIDLVVPTISRRPQLIQQTEKKWFAKSSEMEGTVLVKVNPHWPLILISKELPL